MANSRNTDSAVGSDGQARPDAWHLWRVIVPWQSITGRFVWGAVWRRNREGRRVYKKVVEYSDGGDTKLTSLKHSVSTGLCSKSPPRQKKASERLIVCKASDIEFSKLRISRAYIKLLCIPEGAAKIVSLVRIGNYEVRMFEGSESGSDAAPLFSIELFDHDAQSRVAVCSCCGIEEGAAVYRDFISR